MGLTWQNRHRQWTLQKSPACLCHINCFHHSDPDVGSSWFHHLHMLHRWCRRPQIMNKVWPFLSLFSFLSPCAFSLIRSRATVFFGIVGSGFDVLRLWAAVLNNVQLLVRPTSGWMLWTGSSLAKESQSTRTVIIRGHPGYFMLFSPSECPKLLVRLHLISPLPIIDLFAFAA